MVDIKPYTIAVPKAKVKRLKQKLELTNFPQRELEDAGWKYGAPLADIKRLAHHWQTTFSWRTVEKELNALPHFMTHIAVDGFGDLDVHFLHQKSEVKGAIPLLFIHGWPGSFMEVTRMLSLLKGGDEGRPAFNVVAPSLPNYCFSGGVKKQGFELKQYAETCHKLMLALGNSGRGLGISKYWPDAVSRALAHLYPASVKATHTNWIFAAQPQPSPSKTPAIPEAIYSPRELAALGRMQDWWAGDGCGYLAIQSTKPSTIGFAFADSPVGLVGDVWERGRSGY